MAAVHKFDASIIRSLRTMQNKSLYISRQVSYSKSLEQVPIRQTSKIQIIAPNHHRFSWLSNFWALTKSFFNSDMLPGGSELLMRNYGYVLSSMRQCRNAAGSYFGRNEAVITGDTMLAYDYLHDSQSFLQDGIYDGRVYYCGKQLQEESAEDNFITDVTADTTHEHHEPAIPMSAGEHVTETPKDGVIEQTSGLKEAQGMADATEPAIPPTTAVESKTVETPTACSANETTISIPGFIEWLKNLIAHIRMYFQKF